MKILLLIRHAKSSWSDADKSDFDRPLNARGLKDVDEMPLRLLSKISSIDAFISSPAKRAKATAEKFAAAYKAGKEKILFAEGLYLAHESFFYELVSDASDSFNTIAVFSHNPGITEFANSLTSVHADDMPTCSIFAVKSDAKKWNDFAASKKEFWFFDYPKSTE